MAAVGDDLSGAVAELRQSAEAAAGEFRARVPRAESDRRVPAENMARIRESGLLRVIQARNCGGHELSMRAHLDVISAIAEGCSSTAWVLGVMHAHSWMMAHFPGEAREDVYGADPDTVARLEGGGLIAFRYRENPNGSTAAIAGIFDPARRILGMMPHPERAAEAVLGGTDGRALFEGLAEGLAA